MSKAIKEFGIEHFSFVIVSEIEDSLLNEMEKRYIQIHNSLTPNGYNIEEGGSDIDFCRKGGKSIIGHIKQSLKMKEHNGNERLKDIGEIPMGISYWSGNKKGSKYEGFRVRKLGVKTKEFISVISKNALLYNLDRAKIYLNSKLNSE